MSDRDLVTVRVPEPLREFTGGRGQLHFDASTVDAVLEQIRKERPETPVVMLSTYDNPTYVARSVALGASDYVLKGSTREQLVSAITRAATRQSPTDDSITMMMHV